MKKIINFSLFFCIILIGIIFIIPITTVKAYASEETEANEVIEDAFDDSSFLVVLKPDVSQYRGILESVKELFLSNEDIESLENLSEIPERLLRNDGTINPLISPGLAQHFSKINYKQIIKVNIKYPSKTRILELVDLFNTYDVVLSAGTNDYVELNSVPNDPNLYKQWNLIGENGINILNAWDFTTGSKEIRVGVIDTGIASHEDLNDNVVEGYDFVNKNDITTDDLDNHGTCVAGIIGAISDNGIGVSGINEKISIIPLQISDENENHEIELYLHYVIEWLNNERNNWDSPERIDILNYSGSGFGERKGLFAAIENYPGLFVCAAGNKGDNVDLREFIEQYNLDNLISVGAHDRNNERSIWSATQSSAYGNAVNIYAPGGATLAQDTRNCYTTSALSSTSYIYFNGTSCATPHVTGVAALLLSLKEDLTPQELKEAILESADEITISIPDTSEGAEEGATVLKNVLKLNAYEAVKYVLLNHITPETYYLYNDNNNIININKEVQENASYFNELNGFYKINVRGERYYEFITTSNDEIDVSLYDSALNKLDITELSTELSGSHFIKYLQEGTYYLKVKYASDEYYGTINTKIITNNDSYVYTRDNDILIDVYNNEDNVYTFVNLGAPSYYKISLDARLLNNQSINCLQGAIQVVDEETKEHAFKYDINAYRKYAFNEEEVNYIYVYLEDYKVYEIYITIPSNEYTKANLKIEKVVSEEINVVERFNQEFSETIINNSSDIEYVTSFSIDQTSIFNIEVDVNNYNSSNILFMLFKQEYDTYHTSYFTTSILTENLTNSHLEERYLLEEGIYYIGYFNNYDKKEIEVILNRELKTSDIIDQVIVMDMHPQLPYGTEVRHNKKAYGLPTITEGYTRHIHFLNVTGVPSVSRYDYNFYTSSESIASVSSYGTVLAKQVPLDLTVIITAQYKEDLSIIFTIELTILNDDSNEEKEIESTQTVRIDSLENNRYKLVLTELNSVYPWIQEYNFHVVPNESNTNIATINTFGYITFNTYEDIIVVGQYKINSNVRLKIHIRLVS